jgi:anti-anti-sigma factor
MMEVTERKRDSVMIVGIEGRVDAITASTLESKIGDIVAREKLLLLDCSGLEYMSSSGLRVLLLLVKKLKSLGGKIVLFAVQESVKEVFDISGFSKLFTICDTEDEGLKEFSPA